MQDTIGYIRVRIMIHVLNMMPGAENVPIGKLYCPRRKDYYYVKELPRVNRTLDPVFNLRFFGE